MERQYIIIVAFIAIFASSCQQTETLFIQKQVIDPIEEIIPVQLDTPEKEVEVEVEVEEELITVWEYLQENSQLEKKILYPGEILFNKIEISHLSYCQFTEINDKKIRIIILPLKQGIIPKSINCSDAILNRNTGAANSNITYLTVENNGTIEPETSFSETILNLNSSNDRQLSPINTRLQFLKLNENEKKQLCLLNIYKISVNLKNKNVISYLIRPNQIIEPYSIVATSNIITNELINIKNFKN